MGCLNNLSMHTTAPKFRRNVRHSEAKSRLEGQSFVEEGSPWLNNASK